MVVRVTMSPLPLLTNLLLLAPKMVSMVSKQIYGSRIIPHRLTIIKFISLLLLLLHLHQLLHHDHREFLHPSISHLLLHPL